MARHLCLICDAINTTSPDTCPHCGGAVFDLDRYKAARAEARIIGEQNEVFRKALGPAEWQGQPIRGRVVVSPDIRAMGPDFVKAVLATVRDDQNFMDDHGRDGARSFGMPDVPHEGDLVAVYWKIDLYDNDELMGPEVETDPSQTLRVLHICFPIEF